MHEYTRDLFDSFSNATIIFVYLCIEHAIREFQTERFVLIRFERDAMKDEKTMRLYIWLSRYFAGCREMKCKKKHMARKSFQTKAVVLWWSREQLTSHTEILILRLSPRRVRFLLTSNDIGFRWHQEICRHSSKVSWNISTST
jgi:hypothetical protein